MDLADCKKDMHVTSTSNGFTGGRSGVVKSFGRGGDLDEPAAFVQFDDGGFFAVAVRLLEPESAAASTSTSAPARCTYCGKRGHAPTACPNRVQCRHGVFLDEHPTGNPPCWRCEVEEPQPPSAS